MRPDEGGCADLRRSLTAHLKVVRRLTYTVPRPGAYAVPARRFSRGPRTRKGRFGRAPDGAAPAPRTRARVTTLPRPRPAPGTGPSATHAFRPRRPPPAVRDRRFADLGRNHPVSPGLPECEFLPLARATPKPSPRSTGRRVEGGVSWHDGGSASAPRGGEAIGRRGNSRLIGALTYDTYARAAAPSSHRPRPSRGPAGTRA